jgi:hypothetical protein
MSADFVDEFASAQSQSLDTASTLWLNKDECMRQRTSRLSLCPLPSRPSVARVVDPAHSLTQPIVGTAPVAE